jgi:hypothetical protein
METPPKPAPPPAKPLALSDSEYDAVMAAARPLQPHQRGAFLEALALELRPCGELGDGRVHRAIAQVQKQFWDPPVESGYAHAGKHGRA